MLGSCVVDTPNGSLDCHKEVNSSKKTIADFFGKSSQNSSSAIKKPTNLLSYFTKDPHSRVSNGKTETSVGSSVLEKLTQVPVKNDTVKKKLLEKNLTVSPTDKSSSMDKNSPEASSMDKNSPEASSLDKSSSNASSLDKKRKRASKVLSGDDFVEITQPKRFKSTDSISYEESKTAISLPSKEPFLEKMPENISNTESKTSDQNIDLSNDDDDFISKTDATSTSKKVVLCENDQELPKRKYTKKNSKNCINSNMLNKQSKLKSSKTQQVNVGKSNSLNMYYCEKDKKKLSDKSEREKTDSFNSSDPPQNSKEISASNSCNSSIVNSELGPSSPTYLNTKSDLDESCQSLKVQTCENDDQDAMELSYEEFLLSQTVGDEQSVNMEFAKMSPEKALPSKCDPIPMFVDSGKTDLCNSQQVTVVADIHPEPSLSLPATSNTADNSSKSAEAILKSVSSEVIKSKNQDVNDIVVLDTEVLNKADEIPVVDEHKEQEKQTKSTLDVTTKKVIPSHKFKPVSKAKNQKSAVMSNSIGVKCSQSTLNFEQGNLDLNSNSVSTVSVGNTKGTLKTLSKQSKIGAKIIVRQQNRGIHRKTQSRNIVKCKDKKSVNSAKQNRNHKMSAVSDQSKKMKPKISNKKMNRKKPVKISTKHSVRKGVKKSKASPSEDRTVEAEVSEVKSGSTASADGNRKESLNLSKKSVKSKPDSISKVGLEEISSPSTRKSLRLQEKKALPTSCDDLAIQDEVVAPKEKESKVKPKTTLGTKDKSLNNEKTCQEGGKLAPIFMKKTTSNKKNGKKSKELETEEDRMRRAFLMSGLPEEAKRQQQTINNIVNVDSCDHAPFPSENHVQQIEPTAEINHWDLPEVNLPLIKLAPAGKQSIKPPPWNGSFSVNTEAHTPNPRVDHLKKFSGHSLLSASKIKMILQEIYAANPSYPAQHFYDMALKRNRVAEKSEKISAKSETGKETVNTEEADGVTENQKGKRKSKRSLSRRKSNKKDVDADLKADCQKPDINDANSEEKVCDILWTEKYQPLHSSEIICNSSNVKKLKSWLLDWKQRTDREARKLKKLLMKQKKSKKNKEEDSNSMLSWNDDDSDFALSPSESEDDSLCNTKLLTGPQGIGKTASVYALAMELGYQVFEVNASSVRSGKKILTRLQEATQSHQVSKDKSDSTILSQPSTDVPNAPLKNLDAPSFSTFFKMNVGNTASDKSSKSEKKLVGASLAGKLPNNKRKKNEKAVLPVKNTIPRCVIRKSSETGSWKKIDFVDTNVNNPLSSSDKVSNRLNIASTSLILFDEVDIVFEEDKGFWTAILQFMSSTKRPIILTSTSADFSEQFTGSCEPLHFHTPSRKTLTSHLQTLCLAENVVTKASEISDLVTYYNGDVRSCLLALQFWVNSGASGFPVNIPLSHVSCSNPSSLTDNSSEPKSDAVHTENSKEVADKQLELKDNDDVSKQEFAAHLHFLESYLALDPVQLQLLHLENKTSKTPIDVNQLDNLTQACQHCYSQNFYLCRQLFLSLLSLSRTKLPPFNLSLHALKKVTKSDVPEATQRLKSDLYDSETSCDDVICPTVKEQSCRNDIKPLGNSSEEHVIVNNSMEDNDLELHQQTSPLSNLDENTTLPSQESSDWKTLGGITKFYDRCSDIDIFLTSCSPDPSVNPNTLRSVNCHSSLSPGLWDEFPILSNELRHSQTFTEHTADIAAHMEVRSYLKCRQDVASSSCTADLKQLQQNTSMSTSQHHSEFVKPPQQQDRSVSLARQKAVENVIHSLPMNQSLNSNLIFLDYFPVLRNICRTEKHRQLAKVKRRFFHYFDNINLQLKESTLNILSSDFT
ncbi:family AAA domain-containing 5-like isoform X2 [Octopus vulgaris]|uniref:Family AAA domain-containing 5-like isoform X2 n=1 Tax=Octopus vulgaris TaxID=6645 RepID=A0AA36BRH2_OCTVU|nr:family AAA domain-containing 5-like isoform X2 [Octopus vulgaris]